MQESFRIGNNSRRAHAPLIDQAIGLLVSSLFNNLVNVIFLSTCVSIKLDSVAHFLEYQILNYVRFCAPQT